MSCIEEATCSFLSESFEWFVWLMISLDVPSFIKDQSLTFFGYSTPPKVSFTAKVAGQIIKMVYNFFASAFLLFIAYLIFFHPYSLHPHVDTATIVAFDLTNTTGVLRYELSTDVTFFNEHRFFPISFDHLTAELYFNGTKLGPSDDTRPASFVLKTRRHRRVHPVLRGEASNVSAAVRTEFARELAAGSFSVNFRLKTMLTYNFADLGLIDVAYYYVYDCWLHFMAPPNNNRTALVTGGVRCRSSKSSE